MTAVPVVTVITPAWQRHDVLLERCVPSVAAQDYPAVEHLIVSDGPDPELRRLLPPVLKAARSRWYTELAAHDPGEHWGHLARARGLELAEGSLITYCDDDDSLRPQHCAVLAAALVTHPEAGFALSRMASHDAWDRVHEIGEGPPSLGNLGTPMIMHRKEILEYGTWDHASQSEDWDLVNSWIRAGTGYVQVDDVTCDAWPSAIHSGRPL